MIRLIYVSTAESAVNDATISQILVQANRHNDENGITGLMLYNGMNFMQAHPARHQRTGPAARWQWFGARFYSRQRAR